MNHTSVSTTQTRYEQPLNDGQTQTPIAWAEGNPSFQDMVHAMKIILETGLRKGELSDLRWMDADLVKCQFLVKGKTPSRTVPFGPTTVQVLQERYEHNPASTFIFGEGKRWTLDRIARQFASLAPLVGLDRLTLGTLRRTFFSRLVDSGAPMSLIMAIGGWSWYGASAKRLVRLSDVEVARAYDSALGIVNGGKQ